MCHPLKTGLSEPDCKKYELGGGARLLTLLLLLSPHFSPPFPPLEVETPNFQLGDMDIYTDTF